VKIERIIYSPDAARDHFGVHGEVILEREQRDE
jgi:hypothetical protein